MLAGSLFAVLGWGGLVAGSRRCVFPGDAVEYLLACWLLQVAALTHWMIDTSLLTALLRCTLSSVMAWLIYLLLQGSIAWPRALGRTSPSRSRGVGLQRSG